MKFSNRGITKIKIPAISETSGARLNVMFMKVSFRTSDEIVEYAAKTIDARVTAHHCQLRYSPGATNAKILHRTNRALFDSEHSAVCGTLRCDEPCVRDIKESRHRYG
jgi:hypothetical protein